MKSFISWIGGKNSLKKDIVSRFPNNYEKYVEVFGGAGWVLFHKEAKGYEVYNDLNSELVNLFRIIKFHSDEFIKECDFLLNSRELFQDYKSVYSRKNLTDIQRSANFYMLIRSSYGSKCGTFGAKKFNRSTQLEYIKEINKRLSNVVVENLDFEKLINKYNKEDVLFYLDPPYVSTESYYKNVEFTNEDHIRLRDVLLEVKGKWILSYNDCEFVRELYKDFHIEEIERINNLANKYDTANKKYKELIIRNYK